RRNTRLVSDWSSDVCSSDLILAQFGETLLKLAPYVIAAGLVFPILSSRFACNPAKPWWRSPDLATDLAYWFVVPVFTRLLRIGFAVLGAALLFGIHGEQAIVAVLGHGPGPAAETA